MENAIGVFITEQGVVSVKLPAVENDDEAQTLKQFEFLKRIKKAIQAFDVAVRESSAV
jgi:hypothetical protein